MDNYCAPGRYDSSNNTCFTKEELLGLVNAYNSHIKKQKLNMEPITIKDDVSYLHRELLNRFKHVCTKAKYGGSADYCITRQDFMNELVADMYNTIADDVFRVDGPSGKTDWLVTDQIKNILSQYEIIHKDFKSFGAVPLDCSYYPSCPLNKPNYKDEIRNGKTKFAVVFNMDKLGQPGSHWVALYADYAKCHIYYCDSNGKPPKGHINEVMNTFCIFCETNKGSKPKIHINSKSYQTDSSECGVYSCNFIIRLLAGETYESVIDRPLTFKEINSCRNVYFKNKNSNRSNPSKLCDPHLKI
jgi:hypothetical protein